MREPHWHVNGHELGYCVRGEALVTIFGNQNARDSFSIAAGEMFFVPSGALHHIENTGASEAEFILGFSHERPEEFGLSGTFGAMTDAVLGNTYGLPASAFSPLTRSPADIGIGLRKAAATASAEDRRVNAHKLAVEAQIAPLASPAGSARLARKQSWPILEAHRGHRPRRHPLPDLLRSRHARRHRLQGAGERLFARGASGDLGRDVAVLPQFPFTAQDPLIVPCANPVDR